MKNPPIDLMKAQVIRRGYSTTWRWKLRKNPRLAIERSRIEMGRDCPPVETVSMRVIDGVQQLVTTIRQPQPYPDAWRVVRLDEDGWTIVSEHRKRGAAVKALGTCAK